MGRQGAQRGATAAETAAAMLVIAILSASALATVSPSRKRAYLSEARQIARSWAYSSWAGLLTDGTWRNEHAGPLPWVPPRSRHWQFGSPVHFPAESPVTSALPAWMVEPHARLAGLDPASSNPHYALLVHASGNVSECGEALATPCPFPAQNPARPSPTGEDRTGQQDSPCPADPEPDPAAQPPAGASPPEITGIEMVRSPLGLFPRVHFRAASGPVCRYILSARDWTEKDPNMQTPSWGTYVDASFYSCSTTEYSVAAVYPNGATLASTPVRGPGHFPNSAGIRHQTQGTIQLFVLPPRWVQAGDDSPHNRTCEFALTLTDRDTGERFEFRIPTRPKLPIVVDLGDLGLPGGHHYRTEVCLAQADMVHCQEGPGMSTRGRR